ncbi:MAG: D-2-hydroxyacid dehydrogenase [bacterium]|nr:D-2-hydroxyacid dehydrogenase [bacterium]
MPEKIVFLDASTVDYGDIDFPEIEKSGNFVSFDNTNPDEIKKNAGDADIIITNKVIIDKAVLDSCPNLKLIAVAATGYNIIDIDETQKRGVPVCNVPGYSTYSVAQQTIAFILALATHLTKYNEAAHDGTWSDSPIFTLGTWPIFDLKEKTIGILGMGSIGKEVGSFCKAIGMNVIALKRDGVEYRDDINEMGYIDRYDLETVITQSDVISIHMPLSDYSKHLVNKDFLGSMKKTAFLINMARGQIITPGALLDALKSGEIAGAAIDVMEQEPPLKDDPLLKAPNLIITPHIGWGSLDSRKRLIHEIGSNIESFLNGVERNIVPKAKE